MLTLEMRKAAIDAAWQETEACKNGMSFVQYQSQSFKEALEFAKCAEKAVEAAFGIIWKPMSTAPEGEIWCRNGNVIALVDRTVKHGIMSLAGWGFACGSPTEWTEPF